VDAKKSNMDGLYAQLAKLLGKSGEKPRALSEAEQGVAGSLGSQLIGDDQHEYMQQKSEREGKPIDDSKLPLIPGHHIVGSGYDMTTDTIKSTIFRWSHVGAKRCVDDPQYARPPGLNFGIVDSGKSETTLHLYDNPSKYAAAMCAKAHISGVGACVLDPAVLQVSKMESKNRFYIEDIKVYKSHKIEMVFDSYTTMKTTLPKLVPFECEAVDHREAVNTRKLRCKHATGATANDTKVLSKTGISYSDCCQHNGVKHGGAERHSACESWLPMMKVCAYIDKLHLGRINPEFEGSFSHLDSSFINDVLYLPDCLIDYAQISNDADFFSIGNGFFRVAPPEDIPPSETIPQCNGEDLKALQRFLARYGTSIVTSATFGGRLTRGFEIDKATIMEQSGEGKEEPVLTIIARMVKAENEYLDDRNEPEAAYYKGLMEGQMGRNVFPGAAPAANGAAPAAYGADAPEAATEAVPGAAPAAVPPPGQAASMRGRNAPGLERGQTTDYIKSLLHVSNQVEGGSSLPISTSDTGTFTRKELQEWLLSLRRHGAPIDFYTTKVAEALKHPHMIRAMLLYCGPGVYSKYPEKNTPEMVLEWQSVLFWDLFESRRYKSIPSWSDIHSHECGRTLRRKYYTLINAQQYMALKAQMLFEAEDKQSRALATVEKLGNILDRNYGEWVKGVKTAIDKDDGTPNAAHSTPHDLWGALAAHVEGTKDSSIITAPLVQFLAGSETFLRKCSMMCHNKKGIYLRHTKQMPGAPDKALLTASLYATSKEPPRKDEGGMLALLSTSPPASPPSAPPPAPAPAPASAPASAPAPASASASQARFKRNPAEADPEEEAGEDSTAEKLVVLETYSELAMMVAQNRVAACDVQCATKQSTILDTEYVTNAASDVAIRDLFGAALALSLEYCEGMFIDEKSPAISNIPDDKDPTAEGARSPAALFCAKKMTELERQLCLEYMQMMMQMMATEGGVGFSEVLNSHRFAYMAEQLMARNANYAYLNFPQIASDRRVTVPQDRTPAKLSQNALLGEVAKEKPKAAGGEATSARVLGKANPSREGAMAAKRTKWDPLTQAAQFCAKLLSAAPKPKATSEFDLSLGRSKKEDPTARYEGYLTQWLQTRTKILKEQEERDQITDKGMKTGMDEEIEKLNKQLWCDHYQLNSARIAMELQSVERNMKMSECFMCVRVTEDWTSKETCAFFPKEKEEPFVKEEEEAKKARFLGVRGTVADHAQADLGAISGTGSSIGKDSMAAAAQATRDTLNLLKSPEGALLMVDKWGFQPQQMLSCAGSTINPKEALDEQMTQMQQAMLGPNLAHKDCVDYHKEMMQTMVLKRDKLAQVLGTSRTDFETCEGKEDTECMGEVMQEFIRLRNGVYTDTGHVKREFQPAVAILRGYGSSGTSACIDLNACNTIVQEDYVRDWARRYRRNKQQARHLGLKTGKDLMLPPSYIDTKASRAVAEDFTFTARGNPLFSEFE